VAGDISGRERRGVDEVPNDVLDAAWRIRRAIDALSDEEAAIVRLQNLEGLTESEIGRALDLPPATVTSRSHEAHHRLANVWRELGRSRPAPWVTAR
jgi:DNA-directed RNA polymerase specialized sigma24 family protein